MLLLLLPSSSSSSPPPSSSSSSFEWKILAYIWPKITRTTPGSEGPLDKITGESPLQGSRNNEKTAVD
jgi:hypothetical protein